MSLRLDDGGEYVSKVGGVGLPSHASLALSVSTRVPILLTSPSFLILLLLSVSAL